MEECIPMGFFLQRAEFVDATRWGSYSRDKDWIAWLFSCLNEEKHNQTKFQENM